ncbi:MAG: type II secretion system protein [Candidatus Calescibacterium sp.]|jgi:prepilin-type N-terminal cleavage/methylation domain-containing protein
MIFRQSKQGFTLIEISVVVAIIALFFGLVFPRIPIFKEEEIKSQARKISNFIMNIIDNTSRNKKSLKLVISKSEKKFELHECVPLGMKEEEKQKLEKIQKQIKETFLFPLFGPQIETLSGACEWKKTKELKVSSEITKIFVDGEETFGKEVDIVFQPAKVPLLEIELEKKIWVNLNPYTFKISIGDNPIHIVRF